MNRGNAGISETQQKGSAWVVPVAIQIGLAAVLIVLGIVIGAPPSGIYQTLANLAPGGGLPSDVVAAVNAPAATARVLLTAGAFVLLVGAGLSFFLAQRAAKTETVEGSSNNAQMDDVIASLHEICDEYQRQRDQFVNAFNTLHGNLKHIHTNVQQNHKDQVRDLNAVRDDVAGLPALMHTRQSAPQLNIDTALEPVMSMIRVMIDDTRSEFAQVHHNMKQIETRSASLAAPAPSADPAATHAALDAQLDLLNTVKWMLDTLDNRTKAVVDDLTVVKKDMRNRNSGPDRPAWAAPAGDTEALRAIDAVGQDIRDLRTPVTDLRKQLDTYFRQLDERVSEVGPSLKAVRQSQIEIGTTLENRLREMESGGQDNKAVLESLDHVSSQIDEMRRAPSLTAIRDVVSQEFDQRLTGLGHRLSEVAVDVQGLHKLAGQNTAAEAIRSEGRHIAERLDDVVGQVTRQIDDLRRMQNTAGSDTRTLPTDLVAMPGQLTSLVSEIKDLTNKVETTAARASSSPAPQIDMSRLDEIADQLGALANLVKALPEQLEEGREAQAISHTQAVNETKHAIERVEDRVCEFASTMLATQAEAAKSAPNSGADTEVMEAVSSRLQRVESLTEQVHTKLDAHVSASQVEATPSTSAIDQGAILDALQELRAEMANRVPDPTASGTEDENSDTDHLAPVIDALKSISERMDDLNVVVTASRAPEEDLSRLKEFTTTANRGERLLSGLRLLLQDLSDTTAGYRDVLSGLQDIPAASDGVERLMSLIQRFEGAVHRLENEQKTVETSLLVEDKTSAAEINAEDETSSSDFDGEAPSEEEILGNIAEAVFPPEADDILGQDGDMSDQDDSSASALPEFTVADPLNSGQQSRAFGKLLAGFKRLLQDMSEESAKLRAAVEVTGADMHDGEPLSIPAPAWFNERIRKLEHTVSQDIVSLEARIGTPVHAAAERISTSVAMSLTDFEQVMKSEFAAFGETLSGGRDALEALRSDILANPPAHAPAESSHAAAPTDNRTLDLSGESAGSLQMAAQLMHGFARSVESRFETTETNMSNILSGLENQSDLSSDDFYALHQNLESTTSAMREQVQELLSIAAAVSHEVSRRGSDDADLHQDVA